MGLGINGLAADLGNRNLSAYCDLMFFVMEQTGTEFVSALS